MIYESMTKANVPINMTIEQYKKLKTQVKETMGSYIDLFSQTDRKDVGQVAIQLKAQFMAAGDSAEVATAKIFTMIKESENANMAAQAISTNTFQGIQNIEQASAQAVKTYAAAIKTGDAESQARALHTVFMAIDASIASTVEEQKKLGDEGEKTAERVATAMKNKLNENNDFILLNVENQKLKLENFKLIKKYNTLIRKTKTTHFVDDTNIEEECLANYESSINKIKDKIKNIKKNKDGKYYIDDKVYERLNGTRAEVYNELSFKTSGGLTKDDLILNKYGKIVSKKKCIQETATNRFEQVNLKKKKIVTDDLS
jgi:hypothetical protein